MSRLPSLTLSGVTNSLVAEGGVWSTDDWGGVVGWRGRISEGFGTPVEGVGSNLVCVTKNL